MRSKVHSIAGLLTGVERSGETSFALSFGMLPEVICCSAAYANVVFVSAECRPGSFKAEASSDACEPCPANTDTLEHGAVLCPCKDGFFRAPTDPSTGPCSGETRGRKKKKKHLK